MGIRCRRAYEPPSPDDGYRVLVDRPWPRGLSREQLRLDAWLKELGPSHQLRRWFGHDPSRWEAFGERYRQELAMPERQPHLLELAQRAREETVTLVYGARDGEHNNALVIAQMLEGMLHRP